MIRQGCVNAVVVVFLRELESTPTVSSKTLALVDCRVLTVEPVDLPCFKSRTIGLEFPLIRTSEYFRQSLSKSQLTHAEVQKDLDLWYSATDRRLSTPDCPGTLCSVDYQVFDCLFGRFAMFQIDDE